MSQSFWKRLCAVGLAMGCVGIANVEVEVEGGDWPTFRGADRTGVSKDTGLQTAWDDSGPKLVWEAKGAGRGYASPAIAGDKIFTLGDGLSTSEDKDEYLTCFDRNTGKQLWKTKTGTPWNDGQESWQSSRATPTVDGDVVYVITPFGDLFCAATKDGSVKWKKSLKSDFEGTKGDIWGYSESVLIDGDLLLCTPGGGKSTVVALNKKTGDLVWKCVNDKDSGAGHSSIVISKVGGKKVYVQSTASGAMGFADDGALLWTYPIDRTTCVIPTPIIRDEYVFFVAGYKRGGALLKQVASGGSVKIEEVYGLKTELANKHGGVVLIGDYLYGDSDDQGAPYCANLMDGSIKWKGRGSGRGSAAVAAADGHIYVRFASGVLSLIKADPAAFAEVSHFEVPGSGDRPSWAHPVIVDGMLYLREGDSILCYDIRK